MSETLTREQVLANIKAGARAAKIETDNIPRTWKDRVLEDIPVIPTPSAELNHALGPGGIACGRTFEFFGGESAGKTTLALQIIAEAQKMGGVCGYVDMEHALDPGYVAALGANMDDLMITQPSNGDEAMRVLEVLVRAGCSVVVVDSVAALSTSAELEKDIADANVAQGARLMSQVMRKIQPLARQNNCSVIFINQTREKIGGYGNPETTPGGKALKFYASVRLRMVGTSKTETEGGEVVARETKIKVVKNKVGPPFREAEVTIRFGKGIDTASDLIRFAKRKGIISDNRGRMVLPRLDCPGMIDVPDGEIKIHGHGNAVVFIEQTEGYADALMRECRNPQEPKKVEAA